MTVPVVFPSVVVDVQPAVGSVLHLCAAVFSWWVGEHAAKSGGDIYLLQASLVRYAQAAGSELDGRPLANARTVLHQRGLTRESVRAQWREARAEHGYRATLDMGLLIDLFPPRAWRALAVLIADGPAVASERIDMLLHEVAIRPAAPHAGGDGARVSRRSIENYAWPMSSLMRTLVDLYQHGFPCAVLQRWQHAPTVRLPLAPSANTDRSAPPWRLVRLAWQQVDRDAKSRLGARSTQEELEIVTTCSVHRLRAGLWLQLRWRALFGLICTLGSRSGAVCELRREDLRPRHRGPDGRSGPTIALRPGKTFDQREIHYKPIPAELYTMIEVFGIATDRILAEIPKYNRGRAPASDRPANSPMFPRSLRRPDLALTQAAFYVQLRGYEANRSLGRNERPPVLAGSDGHRYSPHSLRGAAMQAITLAAVTHLPAHHPNLQARDIVEALVDHEVATDRLCYFDKNTLRGREILSRIASELAWRMLTTDEGARKVRDADGYRDSLRQRQILDAELKRLDREIKIVLDEHPRRPDHATKMLFELHALEERRNQVRIRLIKAEQRIERLRDDPTTHIPVPDDIPDDELTDGFDQIEREIEGRTAGGIEPRFPDPVRRPAWITIREAAEILDISYPQAARWVNGQHLPFPAGDPRNPWQPGQPPVDITRGPRRRRIAVEHINPAYVRAEAQRRRLAEILALWPTGWKQADCTAPLVLPDPQSLSA